MIDNKKLISKDMLSELKKISRQWADMLIQIMINVLDATYVLMYALQVILKWVSENKTSSELLELENFQWVKISIGIYSYS